MIEVRSIPRKNICQNYSSVNDRNNNFFAQTDTIKFPSFLVNGCLVFCSVIFFEFMNFL